MSYDELQRHREILYYFIQSLTTLEISPWQPTMHLLYLVDATIANVFLFPQGIQ